MDWDGKKITVTGRNGHVYQIELKITKAQFPEVNVAAVDLRFALPEHYGQKE